MFTIIPPNLSYLSLDDTSVSAGSTSAGGVGLNGKAPEGGATVTLSSSNPAVATVPASVTVPAGAWTTSFTVLTNAVTTATTVTISGAYGGVTWSAMLTVDPASPPDTETPDTSITSAVDGNGASVPNGGATVSNVAILSFTGTDNVAIAGFECRLDGGDFTPCTSPVIHSGLAIGGHSFGVRTFDTSGNRDSSPAAHAWSVDAPPETEITSAVDGRGKAIPPNGGTTRSKVMTFSFTGMDNLSVVGFECRLDGASFKPCSSPITSSVSRGTHTFQVQAIDNNGFQDATPAAFTWRRR
jgi:hypothetical protein